MLNFVKEDTTSKSMSQIMGSKVSGFDNFSFLHSLNVCTPHCILLKVLFFKHLVFNSVTLVSETDLNLDFVLTVLDVPNLFKPNVFLLEFTLQKHDHF